MNYLEEFSRVEIALFELFREGGEDRKSVV